MSCPHLKEVVMLYCDAYPVKKMLPLDRLATAHPCLGCDFDKCPLYLDLMARLALGAGESGRPDSQRGEPQEVGHAPRAYAHAHHPGSAGHPRH